jgi:hypothetical protein
MKLSQLLPFIAIVLTTGCFGETAMRTTAATSAVMVNDYRKGLENYVEAENNVLSATEARINAIAKDQRWIATNVDTQTIGWKATNNDAALNLFSALTTVTAESILTTSPELRTLQSIGQTVGIQVDTKQFDTVVKSLTTLAKDPSFNDRVRFPSEYGVAVSKAYKDSLDKAAKNATENPKKKSPTDQSK